MKPRSPLQYASLSAASLATLALAGCMVGPKYKTPSVPTAPSFKEISPSADSSAFKDNADWQTAKPQDTIPRGNWWTIFHDDGLNALEPQVADANQTLKIADANLRGARANLRVQNATKYPTVGLNPFLGGVRDSANQPYFNVASSNSGEGDLELPLQLSYEVDLWGAVRRNITAAREQSQATAADLQTALLSLQAEVAMDYFELRAADAQQKLLNDTVSQYAEAVRITNDRYLGGVAVKSDLTQAKTQLQDAEVQASDVAIARSQFEHAIAILIGKPPASFSLPPSPLPLSDAPPVIPPGLPSQLLERRPDIAAAERRTAAANEQIGIARAAYFPSLNIGATAGQESTSFTSLFESSSFIYALGPTIGQTFFDGGRRRGISEEALANYDSTTASYRQTVLTAYQQVEDNLVALRVLSHEQDQQREATASAVESERIFNNRYVGGVDTYLQVITAQTSALINQRNDIDILRRRMDASVLLIKVLGGGWNRTQLPTH
ncbi:efflux transporter outer membrane subunit [Granulicella sp. L46]|uniref:efflux transporter outer membrane subunit n=1 Tax=Granulicella sp. L46 TaxID=1641865 RepID=UPI00131BA2FB|nr:efflux transporter outer membrane subunit [Granulicella sp. L46]